MPYVFIIVVNIILFPKILFDDDIDTLASFTNSNGTNESMSQSRIFDIFVPEVGRYACSTT
jgi:hypothetical protein